MPILASLSICSLVRPKSLPVKESSDIDLAVLVNLPELISPLFVLTKTGD